MKKTPGGIIILNMSAINENHMMYDSWDMEHDRHNFLSFWTIFCPFTSTPSPTLTTQRIKILKKWKKTPGDIIILQKCTINDNHLIYGSWDMKCTRQTFFAIMGHFLSFYSANNENLKKKRKKIAWRYHHFTHVYQKIWLNDVRFLRYGAQRTDGQTEKVTYRSGCPN